MPFGLCSRMSVAKRNLIRVFAPRRERERMGSRRKLLKPTVTVFLGFYNAA